MTQQYPKVWSWAGERKPKPLEFYTAAPEAIGFYELGFIVNGSFKAQYGGRAMGITLRERLKTHYHNSHNKNVQKHRSELYFRCKVLASEELVAYVEAVSIAALEYPWNRRNEWTQHWALET